MVDELRDTLYLKVAFHHFFWLGGCFFASLASLWPIDIKESALKQRQNASAGPSRLGNSGLLWQSFLEILTGGKWAEAAQKRNEPAVLPPSNLIYVWLLGKKCLGAKSYNICIVMPRCHCFLEADSIFLAGDWPLNYTSPVYTICCANFIQNWFAVGFLGAVWLTIVSPFFMFLCILTLFPEKKNWG